MLDDIDHKLMQLLRLNARMDVAGLARSVNLTKTPVHKRIQRLQENGYIKSYVTLLDREKIGQSVLVVTQVKLAKQTTAVMAEFEQLVNRLPEVDLCFQVSGSWDFVLHIVVPTPKAYHDFLMQKIACLEWVSHTESSFVMKEAKRHGAY